MNENVMLIKHDIEITQIRIDKADNSIKNQMKAKDYLQNHLAELNKDLWRAENNGKN